VGFLNVAIICKTRAPFISSTDGIAGVNQARKIIIFFHVFYVILYKQMLRDKPISSQRVLPDL
jgi:hypothetical protein